MKNIPILTSKSVLLKHYDKDNVLQSVERAMEEYAYDKLKIAHQRLIGEFTGTLEGILAWEIPDALKVKLEQKIKELDNIK